LQRGKSSSFDGSDEEWLQIVLDALFDEDKEGDVKLSAHKNKKTEGITAAAL
jgi:hypothetical protein